MISPTSNQHSRFAEYVSLLLKLHELETAGRAESEEADAVRDAMDSPWRCLTVEEIKLVRGLSSDLYSIGTPPNTITVVPVGIEESIRAAASRDEYEKILTTLRESSLQLPSSFVAHWRGNCWADMRRFDAALPFFQEARRIQPDTGLHDYMLMHAALSAQKYSESLEVASSIAANPRANSALLWMAGMVFFRCATDSTATPDHKMLWAGIECVERANESIQPVFMKLFKSDAVTSNTLRGLAYDQLDQPTRALDACELALHLEPADPTARYLRAVLTRATNPTASKEDMAVGLRPLAPSAAVIHQEPKFSAFENFQPALAY